MADTRELVLLDHLTPKQSAQLWWRQVASRVKFALRHVVVATAGSPLRTLYGGIYRLHVWYAVRLLKRFPGTRAVYATRGVASGDLVYGVSDIDIVSIGEWPPEEHRRLVETLRRLIQSSPLYDSTLWQQVHTLTELRTLSETDYFFQSRFNQGRTQWKLLAGEDVISSIPPMPPERTAGGYYMELKSWWLHFIMSAFGSGPTASDTIFRNSICYKSVTETLNIAAALKGEPWETSRTRGLARALSCATSETRAVLERLTRSAEKRHLRYDGDIQNDSLQLLLAVLETAHMAIADAPVFKPACAGVQIDVAASEVLLSKAAHEHARTVAALVKASWAGYRSASLLPSVACFAQDDLLLMLEIDPDKIPHRRQVQELCGFHAEAQRQLRQRVTLYLLLRHGAYQLDLVTTIEMWRVLLCPSANPDVFSLLGRPEFTIDGTPGFAPRAPVWSVFASQLVEEELGVRRSAMMKVDPSTFPNSLEIARSLWRQLQLEIVSRTTRSGYALVPLTPAAIQRALSTWGIPTVPVIDQLREAYEAELEGTSTDIRQLIPQLMAMLANLK